MSKFIDADRLRAEIERRTKELDEQIVDIYDSKAILRKDELQKLLSFIDSLQQEWPATAVGKVFTNPKPMNIIVENEQWEKLLGQFDNGQRVRIILVKEDAE